MINMVNKKLSEKDEEEIYQEWLTGKSLVEITKKYPVVISTVQRVIKRKSRVDGTKRNCIISSVFKHLKNANDPLILSLKMVEDTTELLHEKQREHLLKTLQEISMNITVLIEKVESLEV